MDVRIHRFDVEQVKILPFTRTLDNWYHLTSPAKNEAWLAKLQSRADIVAVAPSLCWLDISVHSESKPYAFFTMGGRGAYTIPLFPQEPGHWRWWGQIPLTQASGSGDPFQISIVVVNEAGETFYKHWTTILLPERITPKLNTDLAKEFIRSLATYFWRTETGQRYLLRALTRTLEAMEAEARAAGRAPAGGLRLKDLERELRAWLAERVLGAGYPTGPLPRLIDDLPWLKNAKYTFNYGAFVHSILYLCMHDWSQALVQAFLEDLESGSWRPKVGGLGVAYAAELKAVVKHPFMLPEHLRDHWRLDATVLWVVDPGSPWGDEYLLIQPKGGGSAYIVDMEGNVHSGEVVFSAPRPWGEERSKEPAQPPARSLEEAFPELAAKAALREAWEREMDRLNLVYETLKLLALSEAEARAHGIQALPWVLLQAPEAQEQLRAAPTPLGFGLPEIWKPALAGLTPVNLVDADWVRGLAKDTAVRFWSGEYYRQFGPVREPREYEEMFVKAREILELVDKITSNTDDCPEAALLAQRFFDVGTPFLPEAIGALSWVLRAAREGRYQRLPDWLFRIPIYGWILSRIVRYADIPWNWSRVFHEAQTQAFNVYWAGVVRLGERFVYAPTLTGKMIDAVHALREGRAVEGLEELRRAAEEIVASGEVEKRFPALYNAAWQLLYWLGAPLPTRRPVRDIYDRAAESLILEKLRLPALEEVLSQRLAESVAGGPPLAGLDAQETATALVELAVNRARAHWEALKSEEIDPEEALRKFEAYLEETRTKLPELVFEEVRPGYMVDASTLGENLQRYLEDLTQGQVLGEFLEIVQGKSTRSEVLLWGRVVNAVLAQPEEFLAAVGRHLTYAIPGLLLEWRTKVFDSAEKLERELEKDLERALRTAFNQAEREHGLSSPDWLSVRHHVMNYLMGWAIWHQGQRTATRVVLRLVLPALGR